ncbi:MAG: hypothetical protein WA823_11260 [Candidatus Acidiferrales bacterium]
MRNREFETPQVSEHSKSHERTYDFTESDVARLVEFVAKRADALRTAVHPAAHAQARRALG